MHHDDLRNVAELTDRLRELHRLSLLRHDSYGELYADYLKTGMRMFNMPVGIVSSIIGGQYTILAVEPDTTGFATGDVMLLDQTYCSQVVNTQSTIAVSHIKSDASLGEHPAYRNMALEAYIAAPILVEGEIHGTLNFTSSEPRERPFDNSDVEVIELMAGRLGQIIEQNQIDRERRNALSQLRENTELFESAFNYAAIGMALVSPDGRWLRVNQAVTKLFGYTEKELLKIDFQSVTHPDDLDVDMSYLQEMLNGKRDSYRMEKRYFRKDGREIWALLNVSMVRDEEERPECFVSQIQEITAQKHSDAELLRRQKELESLNQRLELLSKTDPLTQLGNRRALDEHVEKELHRSTRIGQPLSLLVVDVDHFKNYNDTYGHPEGDVALRKLGSALTQVARANDIVARVGGEEFTLLLPHTDEAGCRTVAARLSTMVSQLTGLEAQITISTGGATMAPAMHSTLTPEPGTLMKRADEALYQAKQEGRNRHHQAPLLTA